MKIRNGFVSNSSSSSFMVDRSKINYKQDVMIQHACRENDNVSITGWTLEATYGTLIGFTNMDNFDMNEYFEKIGIPKDAVIWANKDVPDVQDGWPDLGDENWFVKDTKFIKDTIREANEILKKLKYNDISDNYGV